MRHVQANADAAGTGAVIFDVETTELIERDVPLQRMEASVACAECGARARWGWACRGREHVLARAGAACEERK